MEKYIACNTTTLTKDELAQLFIPQSFTYITTTSSKPSVEVVSAINSTVETFRHFIQLKTVSNELPFVCLEYCTNLANEKLIHFEIKNTKDSQELFDNLRKMGLYITNFNIYVSTDFSKLYLGNKLFRFLTGVPLKIKYYEIVYQLLTYCKIILEILQYKRFEYTSSGIVFNGINPKSFSDSSSIDIPNTVKTILDSIFCFSTNITIKGIEDFDELKFTKVNIVPNNLHTKTDLLTGYEGCFLRNTSTNEYCYYLASMYGATNYLITKDTITINVENINYLDLEMDSKLFTFAGILNDKTNLIKILTNTSMPTKETTFEIVDESELEDVGGYEQLLQFSKIFNTNTTVKIPNLTITKSSAVLDKATVMESYKDDEYAQQLYTQAQPYFDDFDLKDLSLLLQGFLKGQVYSMLFYGGSGTGKSTAAKVIPYKCGIPYITINFSVNIEESDLFGTMLPNPNKKSSEDPEFIWQDGIITRAIRNGYCIVLEELNFARPGVLGKLNSLLDENHQIDIGNGEIIKAHPNFRMIATCNIAYEGTNRFNKALVNRFQIIKVFNELSSNEIQDIIMKRTGFTDTDKIFKILQVYESIKKYSTENNLNLVVSLRQLLTIFTIGKYFKTAKDAVTNILINEAFIEDADYKENYESTILPAFDLKFKLK